MTVDIVLYVAAGWRLFEPFTRVHMYWTQDSILLVHLCVELCFTPDVKYVMVYNLTFILTYPVNMGFLVTEIDISL